MPMSARPAPGDGRPAKINEQPTAAAAPTAKATTNGVLDSKAATTVPTTVPAPRPTLSNVCRTARARTRSLAAICEVTMAWRTAPMPAWATMKRMAPTA